MRRYVRMLPDKPEEKVRLRDIDKKTRAILFEQIKIEKFTLLGAFSSCWWLQAPASSARTSPS